MAKRKPADKSPEKKPVQRRKAGQPSERVIGLEEYKFISNKIAEGWRVTRIAEHLGVSNTTIRHHIENHIRPALRQPLLRRAEFALARLERLYEICMDQFYSTLPSETKSQIKQLFDRKNAKPKDRRIFEEVLQTITRPGQSTWIKLAMEANDRINNLLGYTRPLQVQLVGYDEDDFEFRVAGTPPSVLDKQFVETVLRLTGEQEAQDEFIGSNVVSEQ